MDGTRLRPEVHWAAAALRVSILMLFTPRSLYFAQLKDLPK
jgi:hypothetical protein